MLRINASQVAAACGMNRFQKVSDIVDLYTAKLQGCERAHRLQKDFGTVHDDTAKRLCAVAGTVFDETKVTESIKSAVQKLSKPAIECDTTQHADVISEMVTKTFDHVSSTPNESSDLQQVMTAMVAKSRGIRLESKATNKLQTHFKRAIHSRNTVLYELPMHSYIIVGKIDGIIDDAGEKVLVETKTRRSRLFHSIPIYEQVQMEVYLRMVGCNQAILNQHLNDQMSTLRYTRNDDLWESIQNKLDLFVTRVRNNVEVSKCHGGDGF